MNTVVQAILPYLLLYKYYAIFVITFVAALAFPIPPGTLLMASAAFASQGYMSFWGVVGFGSLGNIAGDNVGYWLARRYGIQILNRIGFRKTLASPRYKNIENKILRRPGFFILVTRFEVFSNLAGNIIAGLAKIPYRTYLLYEMIGEIAQVLLYASIGYFIGDNWEYVSGLISRFLFVILIIAAILLLIFWKRITRTKETSV
jgi:membrane protein DedA with SNARE-associated domain